MCKPEIQTQCGWLWMFHVDQIWGRPVTWPKFHSPTMGKKLTSLNQYISVITDIDEKWFVIFEHTIKDQPPSFWLCSFTPTWNPIFLFWHLFSHFFFLFLPVLSTFRPLNALYSNFEWLKISGRTSVRLKSRVPGWGNSTQPGNQKFWTFKLLQPDGSNFRNK